MEPAIHVAFGFHVNCYHSYRGDTNDNLGFGSDIRIIRQIIRVLDDYNKKGVPAKTTWDIENFFSLEKILPEYAPDIIADIKRRVWENGDENIIMGYNNGALSAMTDAELAASINLARTGGLCRRNRAIPLHPGNHFDFHRKFRIGKIYRQKLDGNRAVPAHPRPARRYQSA